MWLGSTPLPQGGAGLTRPVWHPSPNFGHRKGGARVELIVLHYTAMQTAQAALNRLCDPVFGVSAHYLIGEDGHCWQMVQEDDRAWHAGAGTWQGRGDVNSRSVGVELANTGAHPFGEPQMAALEALLTAIMARHGILSQGVIAHSDMAPDRKQDPGRRFDWRRLAMQGLSVWPEIGADLPFAPCAKAFGYPDGGFTAFRQRFRPAATGPCDAVDRRMMADLARRFGVDPPPRTF